MPTDREHPPPSLPEPWQRLPTAATWADLAAAPPVLAQLRQIATEASVRFRGVTPTGRSGSITALFAGRRGTGKTVAAQVLANSLQIELYRIDLSQVVSKYIGETEKNLRHIFDAAERGNWLLFFEEADALFGTRNEVMDSHDRYANIEIAYLLECMERLKGLAVLATNRKKDLDDAFLRRLHYVVEFPSPYPPPR
jgi:SpoVK/Ycf46/Vps4 family AAA+-type ATPase